MFSIIIPTAGKSALIGTIQWYMSAPQALVTEVVVVAMTHPNLSEEVGHLETLRVGRLKVVLVRGLEYFNKAIFLNRGAHSASGRLLLFCDADVRLTTGTLRCWGCRFANVRSSQAMTPRYVLDSATGARRTAPGICAVSLADFRLVDGYCSAFVGWGFEDHDFLSRLTQAGVGIVAKGCGRHIAHTDGERTRFYATSDIQLMRADNMNLYLTRRRAGEMMGTYGVDVRDPSTDRNFCRPHLRK